VNHAGRGLADVGVIGGKIAAVATWARPRPARCSTPRGWTVMPGVIDTQVHFREPGLEWKEDLETGVPVARCWAASYAVFEMPTPSPPPPTPTPWPTS